MAFSRTVNTCHGYAIDGRIKRSILRYIVIVCLLFASSFFNPNNIHSYLTSEREKELSPCVCVLCWQTTHDIHLFVLCCQYYAHDSTLNDNALASACIMDWKSEMNTTKLIFVGYMYENVWATLDCLLLLHPRHVCTKACTHNVTTCFPVHKISPYHEWVYIPFVWVCMCSFLIVNHLQNNFTWNITLYFMKF